jgi:hypothetical protein
VCQTQAVAENNFERRVSVQQSAYISAKLTSQHVCASFCNSPLLKIGYKSSKTVPGGVLGPYVQRKRKEEKSVIILQQAPNSDRFFLVQRGRKPH